MSRGQQRREADDAATRSSTRTSQVTKVQGDDGWGAPHVMPGGGSVGIAFVSFTWMSRDSDMGERYLAQSSP